MKGSPFTQLCRQLAVSRNVGRADLHTHTTFSDGTHTPGELVERAIRAGLKAIAVTDHDSTAGVRPTLAAAAERIEVIPGVEITAEFRGSELHLLGYFVEPDNSLDEALRELLTARRARLLEMARRLKPFGVSVESEIESTPHEISLGRRHLARQLIANGHARSLHDAFTRWLSRPELADVPKRRLPVAEAIELVRGAGGVTSWAHPPLDTDVSMLVELRDLGLQAVECVYPWPTGTHGRRLRAMADNLGLAVSGGSDSHDAAPPTRAIGARTVTLEEVDRIRAGARLGRAVLPLTPDP